MALCKVYYSVASRNNAVCLLEQHKGDARILAGGTDLIVEFEKTRRENSVLIDITRTPGLNEIRLAEDGLVHIGPGVTHAQTAASALIQDRALPLAQACWSVGVPQIRARGTIAGNIVTASPANDTITALYALDAQIELESARRGQRIVPIADFYTGVHQTIMKEDEMVVDIAFAPFTTRQRGIYLKFGLRNAHAIAVANIGVTLTLDKRDNVTKACIAMGSVGPTIVRACHAESFLEGGPLSDERIFEAAHMAGQGVCPIDDVRASSWFRKHVVCTLVQRGLETLRGTRRDMRLGLPKPEEMVLLASKSKSPMKVSTSTIMHTKEGSKPIECVVNGERVSVRGACGKTLLRMLREDLCLTGTKPGCEQGECGSCTVLLDGQAVLSCLTPAARAHNASITTIEGLSKNEKLHIVQRAFLTEDAVQCGYCTPGFIMNAVKLLEEYPRPTREQIVSAISGNLCRCTGYYSIIRAIDKAAGNNTYA